MAMPASYLLFAFPRPAEWIAITPLRYEVIGTGLGPIIGERAGTVAGDSLLVTVGVPRTARAGRGTVAHVRFLADGHPEMEVPLELDVGVVRRLVLSLPREQQGVEPGGRLDVGWRIRKI